MRNSQVGDLLVASTIVEGTILDQSVCLLVHEDEDNAIGLLLNRPLQSVQVGGTAANPAPLDAKTSSSANRLPKPSPTTKHHKLIQTPPQPMIMIVGPKDDPAAGQMLTGKSLHFGGPLSGPVVAVHGSPELGEAEAGEGIFVAAQRDHLEMLLQAEQKLPYRLIIGHLGWTQTQLNHEIETGVWHRMPATSDILSTEDGLLWPALIRRATSHSLSRWLGTEHVADAAMLN
ncbi:YqgE/AlgH family protein [Neorhodopirellula pilleata]|uniref:Uncharacterized protein n=1 Tax=Neorhodopirellula pilleata TaxID=2714738 RepID=A0A5C6A6B5_9BACT|nr:YqgE/AlgH family protein [Neorhodopirellula pilleata]TWT94996.1 hypothetical protein Pla100_35750 [Neorhodopirellula pilleata]